MVPDTYDSLYHTGCRAGPGRAGTARPGRALLRHAPEAGPAIGTAVRPLRDDHVIERPTMVLSLDA